MSSVNSRTCELIQHVLGEDMKVHNKFRKKIKVGNHCVKVTHEYMHARVSEYITQISGFQPFFRRAPF